MKMKKGMFSRRRKAKLWLGSVALVHLLSVVRGFQLTVERRHEHFKRVCDPNIRKPTNQKSTQNKPQLWRPNRAESIRLRSKLWDRLEIEEDQEPFWYLINCVAGLEIDLLRQCREACEGMPDAIKFVVPTEFKTRSHGANRMVTEEKVKYQGYVFAKLRLSPDVYEAIQRSWMGTVNHKGYRKLPPTPVALNELEVETFGLEEFEGEEEEEELLGEGGQRIIVDEARPERTRQRDAEGIKDFLGLQVGDMVNVIKRGKFCSEDGTIRRLKDGKILVRFYTYGSMFEEWMDPGDVRKLSELEALRGLSGPSKPVTQRDLDEQFTPQAPTRGRNSVNVFGVDDRKRGSPAVRNRRQDRVNRGHTSRGNVEDWNREERNWKWYQEQKQIADDGVAGAEWSYTHEPVQKISSRDGNSRRDGSTSKRQRRRELRHYEGKSDAPAPASPSEADDFFASLMSDLAGRSESSRNQVSEGLGVARLAVEEDDFLASLLMAEEENGQKTEVESARSNAVDKYASPIHARLDQAATEADNSNDEERPLSFDASEDTYSIGSFGDELESNEMPTPGGDFFAGLEEELGALLETEQRPLDGEKSDFFASLGTALSSGREYRVAPETVEKKGVLEDEDEPFSTFADTPASREGTRNAGGRKQGSIERDDLVEGSLEASNSAGLSNDDLASLTVPRLKEMLRARGMKVSGNKSELLERLRE